MLELLASSSTVVGKWILYAVLTTGNVIQVGYDDEETCRESAVAMKESAPARTVSIDCIPGGALSE